MAGFPRASHILQFVGPHPLLIANVAIVMVSFCNVSWQYGGPSLHGLFPRPVCVDVDHLEEPTKVTTRHEEIELMHVYTPHQL